MRKRSYHYKQQQNYVDGNLARKVQPKSKPKKKVVIRKHVSRKLNKSVVISKIQYLVSLLVISVVCIILLNGYSVISTKNSDIKKLESQLEQTQNDNLLIKEQMSKNMNLNSLYKEATERLGMIKPTSQNVEFVILPQSSYTQQYVMNETPDKKINIEFSWGTKSS